ncbi:ATP-dependent DNA helicase Q4, partial [Biomphalaria pfeifferi]
NKDLNELRRHTFGNSIDRVTVKRLTSKVFQPCRCDSIYGEQQDVSPREDNSERTDAKAVCGGHERALPIEETVRWLDIREEGVATLLCYLELHPKAWVQNMTSVYATCRVKCYGGPGQLQAVAKKCPPVAVAIAKQKKAGKQFSQCNQVEFNVVDLCDSMGWDSGTVKRELKSLEWDTGPAGFRKSGVLVELSDLAFHFRSRGDLSDQEMDEVTEFLSARSQRQERLELRQLDMLSEALKSVSYKNYWMCSNEADLGRSDTLKAKLKEYFETEEWTTNEHSGEDMNQTNIDCSTLQQLSSDIRVFINTYGSEHTLTGRTIARIFHGITSPNFPAETWGRVRKFWRAHLNVDFNLVCQEATRALVSRK